MSLVSANPLQDQVHGRYEALHYNALASSVVEPLNRIDLNPVATNPGGALTIWQNKTNGHVQVGTIDSVNGSVGEAYFDKFASGGAQYTQTVAAAGTFELLAVQNGSPNGMVLFTTDGTSFALASGGGGIKYTGADPRTMTVRIDVNVDTALSAVNGIIQIRQNGTAIAGSRGYFTTSTTQIVSCSSVQKVALAQNDLIQIYITTLGSTPLLTFDGIKVMVGA